MRGAGFGPMITLANVTGAEAWCVLPGWAWDHREQRMPTELLPLTSLGPRMKTHVQPMARSRASHLTGSHISKKTSPCCYSLDVLRGVGGSITAVPEMHAHLQETYLKSEHCAASVQDDNQKPLLPRRQGQLDTWRKWIFWPLDQEPSSFCLNIKYLSVSLKGTEPHQNIKIHRHGLCILCCPH